MQLLIFHEYVFVENNVWKYKIKFGHRQVTLLHFGYEFVNMILIHGNNLVL